MDTPTPRTNALLAKRRDAALEEWSTEDVMEFLAHSRDLERESLAKDAQIVALRSALTRIHTCQDSPDIDIGSEAQFGLHCGVEDRGCQDRYDGADVGWSQGVERTLEWAQNEASSALSAPPPPVVPLEDVAELIHALEIALPHLPCSAGNAKARHFASKHGNTSDAYAFGTALRAYETFTAKYPTP